MARWLILSSACFLVSCTAARQEEFNVNAITTQEAPLPCIILVEDNVQLTKDQEPITTPANVKVKFQLKPDGTGYERVKIGVKAVRLDAEGKIIHGLRKGEISDYAEAWREIYPSDAKRQIFILPKKRG